MSNATTSSNERDKYGMTAEDYRRYGITAEDYRRRLETMTDEEIIAAARKDSDNPPLTDEQLARFRRPALAKRIRLKLRMGRESFSAAYGIPMDTLKAWERHEVEPTAVEVAYLRLIEHAPELAKVRAEMAAQ